MAQAGLVRAIQGGAMGSRLLQGPLLDGRSSLLVPGSGSALITQPSPPSTSRQPPSFPASASLAGGTGVRSFPAVTTQAGDYVVISIGFENDTAAGDPSFNTLAFSLYADSGNGGIGTARVMIYAAQDATGGSRTITVTPGTTSFYHAELTVVRGSDGPGTGNATNFAQTTSFIRQADRSAVLMLVSDWDVGDPTGATWTPGGSTIAAEQATLRATWVFGRWDDAGTAGGGAYGLASPSFTTPAAAALEMKGTAAAGGGAPTGDASLPVTASIAAAGSLGAAGAASLAATAAIAAAGSLGAVTGASLAAAATITAAGARTATGAASLPVTATITAVTTGASGDASLAVSAAISSAGTITAVAAASLSATASITAAGTRTATGSASLAISANVAATGARTAAGTASLAASAAIAAAGILGAVSAANTLTITAAITAAGATGAVAALTITAGITATPGPLVRVGAATLPVTATITAAGTYGARSTAALTITVAITPGAVATLRATAALAAVATIIAAGTVLPAYTPARIAIDGAGAAWLTLDAQAARSGTEGVTVRGSSTEATSTGSGSEGASIASGALG